MARLTPQQAAEKWMRNLQSSTQDIQAGVNRVQVNPAEQAIAAKDKMVANWNAAINNGSWERGLQNVTLQDWKNKMLNVGIPRIQQGAAAGMPKYQAYAAHVQPFMDNLQAQVQAMPNVTIEDSIARMAAWARGMHQYDRNA